MLIIADVLPGNVSTIDPGGQPFWCPEMPNVLPISFRRYCRRPFRHWVRRPIKRGWWMAKYIYYPAVQSYLLHFHRQVLRPYIKSRSNWVCQRYYRVRRLYRLGVRKLWSSIKSGYHKLRIQVRTWFGLGPPSRRRSSRGSRRRGRRLRRRHLAYGLVMKCRS